VALSLCDTFFSFEAAIESLPAGSAINIPTFMSALDRRPNFAVAGLPSGSSAQDGATRSRTATRTPSPSRASA